MQPPLERVVRLVVVASGEPGVAECLAARLRQDGMVSYATHTLEGCLRVATAVGPDLVVLDPGLPRRLDALLKAHPTSARARIMRLSAETIARARSGVADPAPRPAWAAA